MALVLDTRFLITYFSPPTPQDRRALSALFKDRVLGERSVISSIAVAECIRIIGRRHGLGVAEAFLKRFEAAGVAVEPVTAADAYRAGELALRHPEVPLADALIAALALRLKAKVVSDDPHFRELGVKTVWYKP